MNNLSTLVSFVCFAIQIAMELHRAFQPRPVNTSGFLVSRAHLREMQAKRRKSVRALVARFWPTLVLALVEGAPFIASLLTER